MKWLCAHINAKCLQPFVITGSMSGPDTLLRGGIQERTQLSKDARIAARKHVRQMPQCTRRLQQTNTPPENGSLIGG